MTLKQSSFANTMATLVDMDFILIRTKPVFNIGNDGLPYAIFQDSNWSWEYCALVDGFGIGHWNNYENAVCLQGTIGL